MIFRKCVIGMTAYGGPSTLIPQSPMASVRSSAVFDVPPTVGEPGTPEFRDPAIDFDSTQLLKDLHSGPPEQAALIEEFLVNLAVCHSIIPEEKVDDKGAGGNRGRDATRFQRSNRGRRAYRGACWANVGAKFIKYQASSPDEYALVVAAKACGYVFTVRLLNLTFELKGERVGGRTLTQGIRLSRGSGLNTVAPAGQRHDRGARRGARVRDPAGQRFQLEPQAHVRHRAHARRCARAGARAGGSGHESGCESGRERAQERTGTGWRVGSGGGSG